MKRWQNDEEPVALARIGCAIGWHSWREFITKSDGRIDRCLACHSLRYLGKEATR